MPSKPVAKRYYRRYTVREIRKILLQYSELPWWKSDRSFCRDVNIPPSTLSRWKSKINEYLQSTDRGSYSTLHRRGKTTNVAFKSDLLSYMATTRDNEDFLTPMMLVKWVATNQPDWVSSTFGDLSNNWNYTVAIQWCRRFAYRNGFSFRVPCYSKRKWGDLTKTRDDYAVEFWNEYENYSLADIINVDETPVYYDMPPSRTLAKRGGSSRVKESEKHSDRISVVLGIRADGELLHLYMALKNGIGRKLPPLIIVRGEPGGEIEKKELPTYPVGPIYAVQANAFMDERVWSIYLKEVIKYEVEEPSLLIVDNLQSHVSNKALGIMENDLHGAVCLACLPPNATCVLQPLDVGVMGPFKSLCRSEWLTEERVSTAAEKRLKMIQRTIKVWKKIKESTVVSSFEKALPYMVEL